MQVFTVICMDKNTGMPGDFGWPFGVPWTQALLSLLCSTFLNLWQPWGVRKMEKMVIQADLVNKGITLYPGNNMISSQNNPPHTLWPRHILMTLLLQQNTYVPTPQKRDWRKELNRTEKELKASTVLPHLPCPNPWKIPEKWQSMKSSLVQRAVLD